MSCLQVSSSSTRMRFLLIAALFSVLGTSLAVTRKPSAIKLQWLNSGKGMKITFPDKTTDEIELQADPQNNCFYHGHLLEDHESQVDVDGCKSSAETIVEIHSIYVPCGFVDLLLTKVDQSLLYL